MLVTINGVLRRSDIDQAHWWIDTPQGKYTVLPKDCAKFSKAPLAPLNRHVRFRLAQHNLQPGFVGAAKFNSIQIIGDAVDTLPTNRFRTAYYDASRFQLTIVTAEPTPDGTPFVFCGTAGTRQDAARIAKNLFDLELSA